ncbi:protein kinase domain-containing protein [Bacillus spongiae]|uniref:protein kinase domain-containing protein n=1 Tax=Bacillus spongiae TaxID=2683610 RepID=UPI00301534F9
MKKPFSLPLGTKVKGKWHKECYTIVKELGYGANGVVYLAQCNSGEVALKICDNSYSVTSEVNVLKAFMNVKGTNLAPSLMDVDDWQTRERIVPFYTMEFIKGPNVRVFVDKKGFAWVPVLMLQLLANLDEMHREGWVFGDLKPDNLIVTGPPYKIRCIDVGGTTMKGRGIKEFTEFFDRGYWGMGSRKADERYDLFAIGMIMINLAYGKQIEKKAGGIHQLNQIVEQNNELIPYKHIVQYALRGKYQSANDMRKDIIELMSNKVSSHSRNKGKGQKHVKSSPSRYKKRKQSKWAHRLETLLVVLILGFLYFLYIYGEIL